MPNDSEALNNPEQKEFSETVSNRSFGLIFAVILCVVAILPLVFSGGVRMWAVYLACAFVIPALLYPIVLGPLNRGWAKFGQFSHKVINPILMALIFFITVLPTGLILRLLGKDPMQRKLDSALSSYWITRKDAISKESFDNQF